MPQGTKKLLVADDFMRALKRLDFEMSEDPFLHGFAPINVVSAGGFVAVTHWKNREMTGDIDYFIEPEHATDPEIQVPFQKAILKVAEKEFFEHDWMNDELKTFATPESKKTIFEKAYTQNVKLFDGEFIQIWAAPFEWQLERKMRRVAFSGPQRTQNKGMDVDMDDVLVLFKHFRTRNGGPLDMEYYRTLNMNGFDIEPEPRHMEKIATAYRKLYNEDLFSIQQIG